jgi:hypothetical protein
MNVTTVLFSQAGDEKLIFRTMEAHGALFEGQHHSWIEHESEGIKTPSLHTWQDTEEKAQAHLDRQVKSALALGWLASKKTEQLRLF